MAAVITVTRQVTNFQRPQAGYMKPVTHVYRIPAPVRQPMVLPARPEPKPVRSAPREPVPVGEHDRELEA